MNFDFYNHNGDLEGFLQSLHKVDPEGFREFINKVVTSDKFYESVNHSKSEYASEIPDFIRPVFQEWRNTVINANTPMLLTDAYIRFNRAWNSYCAAVLGNMFGDVCDGYWQRTKQLGFLLDDKILATENLDERVHLMNLFRLLIPQYIDMSEENGNLEYEKSWNKALAIKIVESNLLTPERCELLIRVREDFKRLPTPLSKFIKSDLPKYLEAEIERINSENLKDLGFLKKAIKNLDNYIQWHLITENRNPKMEATADACFERISNQMAHVGDIEAWVAFANLMITGFAPFGTVKDRSTFMKRVEERLWKAIEIPDPLTDYKAFAERLMLASIFLENIFLDDRDCDIYTSYWTLMHQDKMYGV